MRSVPGGAALTRAYIEDHQHLGKVRDHQYRHGSHHHCYQSKRLMGGHKIIRYASHPDYGDHHKRMDCNVRETCDSADEKLTQHNCSQSGWGASSLAWIN